MKYRTGMANNVHLLCAYAIQWRIDILQTTYCTRRLMYTCSRPSKSVLKGIPIRNFPVRIQQWAHHNMRNPLKVNKKDTRTTSIIKNVYQRTPRCLINEGGRLLIFRFFCDPFPLPLPWSLLGPLRLLIFKECWGTKFFSVAKWVFAFIVYFSFNLEINDFFVICFLCNVRKLNSLFTYIYFVYWYVRYSFDYYLVLTSFTSCLFT